jgi:hypothetical protein
MDRSMRQAKDPPLRRQLWLGLGSAIAACGEPAGPLAPRSHRPDVDPAPVAGATAEGGASVTSATAATYPSLEHYPAIAPTLVAALEREHGASILAGLDESLRPYRWPDAVSWESTGFIRLEGDGPLGFVRRVGGNVLAQDGTHDLGCAGGFLEGMRLLWLPTLTIEDLGDCEAPVRAGVTGAAFDCEDASAWGLVAIANLAARLPEHALPNGRAITVRSPIDASAAAELYTPGVLHLCTVSHVSRRRRGRWHHHMMAITADEEPTILRTFDTTGVGAVAWRQMRIERLPWYVDDALATNPDFRYQRGSTELHCLATTMPGQ